MRHQQSSLGGIGLANGLQSLRKRHLVCGLLEGVAGKCVSTETIDQRLHMASSAWQPQGYHTSYMVTQDSDKNVPRSLSGSFKASYDLVVGILEHHFCQMRASVGY